MSRERAHRRAAREAERAAALAEAERERAKRDRRARRRAALVPARRAPRPPRYGALPLRVKAQLGVGWLALQLLLWQLVASPVQRVGLAVLTLLALPIVVVLTVNTSSRRRPLR